MKKNIVGGRIAVTRKRRGLTQEALAEQLNVTRQAISNWESGKSLPDIEMLKKLAEAFDVTVESLIYDGGVNGMVSGKNEIGLFCRRLATAVYIAGFGWGIVLWMTGVGPDDIGALVFLTKTLPFWIKSLLAGTALLGVSEIIRLLGKEEAV